MKTHET
jgi:ribosomal protein S9